MPRWLADDRRFLNWDVKKQADQIATLVSSGVDALIVLPIDPERHLECRRLLSPRAYRPSAPTITCSARTRRFDRRCTITSAWAKSRARRLAEKLGGKGKIGILTLALTNRWAMRSMECALRCASIRTSRSLW